jgi:hypothetical protein
MARPTHTHDWLSLVSLSGLLVSEPVLATAFPRGPERVSPYNLRRFTRQWERFKLRRGGDPLGRWVDFILYDLLGWERERLRRGRDLPPQALVDLLEVSQTLRPSRALLGADGAPALLLSLVPPAQDLDRPEVETGRWKASPFTKLDRLLRESGVPLGLLSNGAHWRLVYAAPGLSTAHVTWSARTWADERVTLDAFYTLLQAERFFAQPRLLDLIHESQARQIDVADQLGQQVRAAVGVFVRALDGADRAAGGALLAGVPLEQVYEMALTLMMRLVFILYAEENGLLPHGEVLYDRSYGLTYLTARLEAAHRADAEGDTMRRATDAWGQLLATFRLIHDGCAHPDLSLRAYGGDLFDPRRYRRPDAAEDEAALLEDPRLALNNAAVYAILRKLTFARARLGALTLPQRVSYRSLDIEQIGYVYEGLLDHRLARAGAEPLLQLRGPHEALVSLAELEALAPEERAPFLAQASGRDEHVISNALDAVDQSDAPEELRAQVGPALGARAAPYARLVVADGVIPPGHLYVTAGQSRRATGTHYTPQSLTAPIVETTLGPLVYERFQVVERNGQATWQGSGLKSPAEILDLKVCDMAMGSGAFLVQACRYLAQRLVDAWDRIEAGQPGIRITPFGQPSTARPQERLLPADRDQRVTLARRLVAERCLYGVDKNPLAVEMARLSLWLTTLARDRPFTFLDHALKCGDSLVGAGTQAFLAWAQDAEGTVLPLLQEMLVKDLQRAARARRELQTFTVLELDDARRKAALHAQAEAALARVRLGCDLLIGAQFTGADARRQKTLRAELLGLYTSGVGRDVILSNPAARKALDAAAGVRPFHWPFEFPEVFMPPDADPADPPALLGAGFDAFVGNPPFIGGQRIRAALGGDYLHHIKDTLTDRKGSADYSAFFFLRAFDKLRSNGRLGLLATNTIAQGATREVGLEKIARDGGSIYAATSSMPWPGVAAVYVSVVHIAKGTHHGNKMLDGQGAPVITPLLDSYSTLGNPKQLRQNTDNSFQGSNVLGLGFTMPPEEAQALIAKDPHNAEVLFPYLIGRDLNSSPDQSPSRWVINFFDWPLEKAEQYPDCMAIVRKKVYPERQRNRNKQRREIWWRFTRPTIELYQIIAPLERVLVVARVSKTVAFVFVPKGWVYNEKVVVFPFEDYFTFALLQSSLHYHWAWKYSSTLKADLNYSPTDVFETFPFPQSPIPNLQSLSTIGETYHEHRRQVMLARQQGLTKTYNRFHDPACHDADVVELRRLHVEMDRAVLAAYGWDDLALDHDFRGQGKEARYTLGAGVKEELLRRLLLLNFEIAAREEAEGEKADKPQPRRRTRRSRRKKKDERQLSLFED